eukprot:TRINITY_DN72394_c0_g1_i1.p4 TRINITY_DN72394_c0_g1~~TRINITY_DN72394_c0_g1_i1.p4  ORF type:complete len:169 (-),score=11.47 TRINITY_DN72394_c0_g1_i1:191-625(-)
MKTESGMVRGVVVCTLCEKPRCIYSDCKLTQQQKQRLQQIIEDTMYVCGSPICDDDDLKNNLGIFQKIDCNTPVEGQYYSCKKFDPVCVLCGSKNDIVNPPQEIKLMYKSVRNLCQGCLNNGKNWNDLGVCYGKLILNKKQRLN